MTAAPDHHLGLLLCDADDRAPVLAGGMPDASLADAPAPARGPAGEDSLHLEALDRDPNDLEAQRWAVIAPEGPDGDAALAAVRALVEHRRAQQGAEPAVFRVPDGMDAAAAHRWKHDVLRAEAVPADERPRYLLILGDLDRVSLELQHVLGNGAFVGRLHCATPRGYRDYAEKVVARERAAADRRPRALYYTVHDGTPAAGSGHRHLVEPCLRMTADLAARGKLVVDGPTEVPYSEWGPDELLAVAGVDAPSLLVSLSHGVGAPRRGWRSPDQQRALQGALSLGADEPLTADTVRASPFLPGGVWMCVACYGAGTPSTSAYHAWLAGHGGERAAAVLRGLPRPGERPFVAALPQALLANPAGPLAVIGHMDLAWTYGFTDPAGRTSRASRMHATQRALLGGSRVGVGLDALMHAYREVNDELMSRYQARRDAAARGQPDPVDPRALGEAWMQRNDLRGYVLLGDPAARLAVPLASRPRAAEAPDLPTRSSPAASLSTRAAPPEAPARPAPEPEPRTRPDPTPPAPRPAPEPPPEPGPRPRPEPTPPASPPEGEAREPPRGPPAPEPRPSEPRTQPVPPSLAPSTPVPVESPMTTPTPPAPPFAPALDVHAPTFAPGAAPQAAVVRPRTLDNPEIGLRERAVLAMLRGDEAPRSIAVRFGLPLEEIFYWLDVYREAGRRALAG
jgi:hypothetical protein